MGDPDPNDIPDLVLPSPKSARQNVSVAPARPATSTPAPASKDPFVGFGDMEIERGAMSAPPASLGAPQQNVTISVGDDDDDMELERGAMVSLPPAHSGRPSGGPPSSSRMLAGSSSGLDVAYKRPDAHGPAVAHGPGVLEKIGAYVLTALAFGGAGAALVKLVHRASGRSVIAMLPHAFDATSTVQSGAFAVVALVLGIAVGYIGFRTRPRSYAIVGAGSMLVLASLAMVTVTLVSTEEHPSPPDGALLIPYLAPLTLFLLGLGMAALAPHQFYRGGARRALPLVFGAFGGALVFAAIELSALASKIP